MVVKVYVSLVSGNKEIKGKQEVLRRLLESKKIEFEEVDITDLANEHEKQFMREHSIPKEGQKIALPPQIFNDLQYCGDYDDFYEANESDDVMEFLKLTEKTHTPHSEQSETLVFHTTSEAHHPCEDLIPPEEPVVSRLVLGQISVHEESPDESKDETSDRVENVQVICDEGVLGGEGSPPPLPPRSGSLSEKTRPKRRDQEEEEYENVDMWRGDGREMNDTHNTEKADEHAICDSPEN